MSDSSKAVFLSYAKEDAPAAKRIAEALRGFGVEVWFDQNELRGGDKWDANIRSHIKGCALFIPVISRATQTRDEGYFRLEWKLADDRSHLMAPGKAFIVPVVIDAMPEYGATVPDSFNKAQWTRLPGGEPSTAFIEQVKRLLAAPAGRGQKAEVKDQKAETREQRSEVGILPVARRVPAAAWVGVLALLVVAVGFFWWRQASTPSTQPTGAGTRPATTAPVARAKSIAVLPFENRSKNEDDAFFTDGIHDDLLTQVARIRDIKTISRTSVMAYKGTAKNMRTIGAELGVATLLEGGVQRAGKQVRINVQLIDTATDAHLWAETYTREMTAENIFAIQSEIAAAIAKALQAVLSPAEQQQLERRATTNLAALEKYFEANALARDLTTENLERAIARYQDAIRLDDQFALPYARLAGAYLTQVYFSGLPQDLQMSKAEPLLDKAIQLDPLLSEAYVAQGQLREYRNDVAGAKAAYEHAIALKPNNDSAYASLAVLLFWHTPDRERAMTLIARAQELSPEESNLKRNAAEFLFRLGRTDEARTILEKLTRENPSDALSLAALGNLETWAGNMRPAFVALRKAYAMDPGSPLIAEQLRQTYEAIGDKEQVNFWLERSVAVAPTGKVALDSRLRLLLAQGKLVEADALWAKEWKPGAEAPGVVFWEMMMADIKAGRNLAPRARNLKVSPELFRHGATVIDSVAGLFRAKDVAVSLIAAGERSQADHLLEAVATAARSHPEPRYRFILAKVHVARGDRTAFFQTLRSLVETEGPQEWYYNDPEFAVYRDEPEFQALFGDLPQKLAEQLAMIRRMEANGEFAPIPPQPGAAR